MNSPDSKNSLRNSFFGNNLTFRHKLTRRRFIGGLAAVALIAVTGSDSPLSVIIVLLAGGVALLSHGGKAGTRVASNISNPANASCFI